eukprot:CAMPEP_0183357804 /NCGR_PEP_ID=MMETSP0164_2-20130417/47421_1 /TAXON_ID=221442 /ORGANISM="Coccolithus pelagicus ssp braarudi, Strain PLY182g" /LENGTH=246 /DNA_ID=CAMNT_0025531527 /DNA_START=79 /DNA_END=822 /DNA_ORIENTATION=+
MHVCMLRLVSRIMRARRDALRHAGRLPLHEHVSTEPALLRALDDSLVWDPGPHATWRRTCLGSNGEGAASEGLYGEGILTARDRARDRARAMVRARAGAYGEGQGEALRRRYRLREAGPRVYGCAQQTRPDGGQADGSLADVSPSRAPSFEPSVHSVTCAAHLRSRAEVDPENSQGDVMRPQGTNQAQAAAIEIRLEVEWRAPGAREDQRASAYDGATVTSLFRSDIAAGNIPQMRDMHLGAREHR